MILTCPICATRYEIASGSIPPQGRTVKCASCHHSWQAGGQAQFAGPRPATTGTMPQTMDSRTSFSRPARPSALRSTHGNAALAALFDEPEIAEQTPDYHGAADEAEPAVIEPARADVSPANARKATEAQIRQALSVPSIARLVEEQRREQDAQPGPAAAFGEQRLKPEPSPDATSTEPALGPVRMMARGLVGIVSALNDLVENAITAILSRGNSDDDRSVTPGDRKVSEWRLEQIRRARQKMTPAKLFGWACLALAVAGVSWSFIMFRGQIGDAWPQARSFYQTAGLLPQPELLTLGNVDYRYARSTQGPVVELFGTVSNDGETQVRAPLIRADALAANGTLLSSWAFALEGAGMMAPQSELPFRTRALAPEGTTRVDVSLIGSAERADLERTRPDVINALEQGRTSGAGTNAFFMRKTTSDWGAGSEPDPVESKLRD